MLILKLALRTIMRRKSRMILIGSLVAFGTFISVFGGAFSASAARVARSSIVDNFTGDVVLYSARSRDLPSPFAFNTPLPTVKDAEKLGAWLDARPDVAAWTAFAQNYGLVQAERNGKKFDLPFIFYAVEPASYRKVFDNFEVSSGSYFGADSSGAFPAPGSDSGVMISLYQNEQYKKNFGITLEAGERVTLLGITEGGANSLPSLVVGLFEPRRYKSVFDYINFMDAKSFAELYNYTGVAALPDDFEAGLATADQGEDAIFGLAGTDFGTLDVGALETERLSGYTMVAVRLSDRGALDAFVQAVKDSGFEVKAARWDEASGFYATISKGLQAFIWIATFLVFLVVGLIFANTLIINVVERTAEIGTMRALGTDKSFVRSLFLAETLMVNLAASLAGMVVATVVVLAFRSGVPLPETVSQFLIGGGNLIVGLSPAQYLETLAAVVVVSVLAVAYPVRVATSITPLKAMSDR